MDCSLPGSSVQGILQARRLQRVAISFSRGSARPRDWTWVSHIVALPSELPGRSIKAVCIDCSLPGSSDHGILQARILEWVAMPFPKESSWPRDWTQVSHIASRLFTIWATKEPLSIYLSSMVSREEIRQNTEKIIYVKQNMKRMQLIQKNV